MRYAFFFDDGTVMYVRLDGPVTANQQLLDKFMAGSKAVRVQWSCIWGC